jgi:hypothetical protein
MYPSRFLQRAWFRSPKYFNDRIFNSFGAQKSELDIILADLIADSMGASFAVNLSNWGIGIVTGVYDKGYSVQPEWKKFGGIKEDSRPILIPESHIILSIDVALEELLTHTNNSIRTLAMLRNKKVDND